MRFEKLSTVIGETAYDVDEAAGVLNSCGAMVRQWVREGRLESSRIGRRIMIRESALRKFVGIEKANPQKQ